MFRPSYDTLSFRTFYLSHLYDGICFKLNDANINYKLMHKYFSSSILVETELKRSCIFGSMLEKILQWSKSYLELFHGTLTKYRKMIILVLTFNTKEIDRVSQSVYQLAFTCSKSTM